MGLWKPNLDGLIKDDCRKKEDLRLQCPHHADGKGGQTNVMKLTISETTYLGETTPDILRHSRGFGHT